MFGLGNPEHHRTKLADRNLGEAYLLLSTMGLLTGGPLPGMWPSHSGKGMGSKPTGVGLKKTGDSQGGLRNGAGRQEAMGKQGDSRLQLLMGQQGEGVTRFQWSEDMSGNVLEMGDRGVEGLQFWGTRQALVGGQ